MDHVSQSPSRNPTAPRPCLAELFRTRYPPPDLVLRVAKVLIDNVGDDKRAYRMLLSDGERVIQAVFKTALHPLISAGECQEGTSIILQDYGIARAKRLNGKGSVIYLTVTAFQVASPASDQGKDDAQQVDVSPTCTSLRGSPKAIRESPIAKRRKISEGGDSAIVADSDPGRVARGLRLLEYRIGSGYGEEVDDFEIAQVDLSAVENRRQELQRLGNGRLDHALQRSLQGQRVPQSPLPTASDMDLPVQDSLGPRPNVRTLYDLLFSMSSVEKRNYLCDVFAVITWVSPSVVKRPSMPLKRHVKIRDPSIAGRAPDVSLSVFVDAKNFRPSAGTVALFRNLTAQAWDGVILNAYEKDCRDIEWFITDSDQLESFDVKGMVEWWARQVSTKGQKDKAEVAKPVTMALR